MADNYRKESEKLYLPVIIRWNIPSSPKKTSPVIWIPILKHRVSLRPLITLMPLAIKSYSANRRADASVAAIVIALYFAKFVSNGLYSSAYGYSICKRRLLCSRWLSVLPIDISALMIWRWFWLGNEANARRYGQMKDQVIIEKASFWLWTI